MGGRITQPPTIIWQAFVDLQVLLVVLMDFTTTIVNDGNSHKSNPLKRGKVFRY